MATPTPILRKGERTRRLIVERAAPVFNQRGYAGASMSELVAATGLEKGGIYNHFGSKEALALESFDYGISLMAQLFADARASTDNAADQLVAMIHAFGDSIDHPVIPGGCPLMNTAIDCDDTQPALAQHARQALTDWHRLIGSIVKDGKQRGDLDPVADPYALASVITSMLEGALAMSRLLDDPAHLRRAVLHLSALVDENRMTTDREG
jgi:AcrR family transcriptional regulator